MYHKTISNSKCSLYVKMIGSLYLELISIPQTCTWCMICMGNHLFLSFRQIIAPLWYFPEGTIVVTAGFFW